MPETTQFGDFSGNDGYTTSLKANTLLKDRYKIEGVLGGGGMGTVYQARDMMFPDVKRYVAVKEMVVPETNRENAFKTYHREANILAALNHPAIPKIYEFFEIGDRFYLIMELIKGSDLEQIINKTKELPIPKILEWAIDLCDVLSYLHSHEPEPIIFRDLKPSNIMIDAFGKVRLIDFGIAKSFVSGAKQTQIGTEGYSAPEQYRGQASPLSDVYGLGATLHHVITRSDPRLEPPFSFNERPISSIRPSTPPRLISIVERALNSESGTRFNSCKEMKDALEAVRFNRPEPGANSGPVHTQPIASASPQEAAGSSFTAPMTDFFAGMDEEEASIEPRWKFATEDEIRAAPTAIGDLAFVGSYDTNVWAINLESGEFVWKYPTNAGIASSPVPVIDKPTGSKLVLFGSEDNTFYAVDMMRGRLNWTYSTQGKIRSTPCVAHDHVFFGSDDGKLYALAAGNGRYLWDFDMGSPVRTRPYVTNDLIIVSAEMGEVFGIELSGKRKWSYRAKRGVNSSPYVDEEENICFIGGMDGFLYALDASSGYTLWRFRTTGAIISSPISNGQYVFFGSTDNKFYAVNIETGKEKWAFDTEAPIVATPAVQDDKAYIGSTNGTFYCVDISTGKQMWKYQTDGGITAAPFITDNMILVGSMDKTLYALPLVG